MLSCPLVSTGPIPAECYGPIEFAFLDLDADAVRASRSCARFFCRQEEHGKFYCSACLVQQLSERGARKITVAAWTVATKEAFGSPGLL